MNLEGWSWKWKSSSDNFLVIGNFSSFHELKFFSEIIFREFCKHFKNFIQKIVRYYYNRNEKNTIQFTYNKNVKFYPISLYFTFNRRNFPPPTPLPIRTSRILLRRRISLSIISKLWEWAVNFAEVLKCGISGQTTLRRLAKAATERCVRFARAVVNIAKVPGYGDVTVRRTDEITFRGNNYREVQSDLSKEERQGITRGRAWKFIGFGITMKLALAPRFGWIQRYIALGEHVTRHIEFEREGKREIDR